MIAVDETAQAQHYRAGLEGCAIGRVDTLTDRDSRLAGQRSASRNSIVVDTICFSIVIVPESIMVSNNAQAPE
jgi:hypothetical protein